MLPLEIVQLTALMARTRGKPDIKIGLIDGPVFTQHRDLVSSRIHQVSPRKKVQCANPDSIACRHATFIAGVLCARRSSPAPAICPDCTLLVRPIFIEASSGRTQMPSASPQTLAEAMLECIDEGARIINLSLGITRSSAKGEQALEQALQYAAKNGVIVVAAAGNQGAIGSPTLASNPWLLPVVACGSTGWPMWESNLGRSVGIRGLSAPGQGIVSLAPNEEPRMLGGTSVAVPFVTGAIALLWSEFPTATAAQIKHAVTRMPGPRRTSIVPRLLNGESAYEILSSGHVRRRAA
jgi:subtilisin family serine protease